MSKLVSLVKGEDRRKNIINALRLIQHDLAEIEDKERILIKPNLTSPTNPAANTDVEAIKAIMEFINWTFGEKEFLIIEGSGGAYLRGKNTEEVLRRFGYYQLRNERVELRNVEKWEEFSEFSVKTVNGEAKVRIAKPEVDYTISVAIPKTHDFAIATLGIKNMMGLIRQEDKVKMHGYSHLPGKLGRLYNFEKFLPGKVKRLLSRAPAYSKSVKLIHHNLLSLAKNYLPDLAILDGYYCMEGEGPINGDAVKMEVCIASTDALKADGIGVRIMGLEPEEIGYLYYAAQEGLGDYSTDGLLGNIETVRKKFRMHSTYEFQKKWKL